MAKVKECSIPQTKVELTVSASNLADVDRFSKSDPICVLLVKELDSTNFMEVGRTERVDNNLHPKFAHCFVLDYFFEEKQHLRFEIYHMAKDSTNLKDQEFLGAVDSTLGKIVGCIELNEPLVHPNPKRSKGVLRVVSELRNPKIKGEVTMCFRGENLDKMDLLGLSDPFLVISKQNDDGDTFSVVHKTEAIKKTLTPEWREFTMSIGRLCNGEMKRRLRFRCIDWNRSGKEDLIGEFETNMETLAKGPSDPHNVYKLINPVKKKKKKRGYSNSGEIHLQRYRCETHHDFLDYIVGGTLIKVAIAVDFTSSNGNPEHPSSLHYYTRGGQITNEYAMAIDAVGGILEDYDSDSMIPAFGFGAKLGKSDVCSDNFPMNSNPQNPDCEGVAGVLEAYYSTLNRVNFSGPTNFAPSIKYVSKQASEKQDGTEYHILLILTDGVITDMGPTKKAIIEASTLPLSIIIVGIGKEDFTAMDILDGDHKRLQYKGKTAARDIVQFVAIRDFHDFGEGSRAKERLAKQVLAEVPDQVTSFMKSKSILPVPRRRRPV